MSERPRERLLEQGPSGLSDGELLAVLIGSGRRGATAVDLARAVIQDFGSLRDFLCAEPQRCLAQRGIGPARYARLQAALELARRHYQHDMRAALANAEETRSFVISRLRDKPYEVFCVLYLDVHESLIGFQELFRGSTDESSVYPKEVVREVIARNAHAVMFAHNHPSGSPEPSQKDWNVTKKLKDALALIDVKVIDHLVVGGKRCVSFAQRGLI